jgi:hypothetical protein
MTDKKTDFDRDMSRLEGEIKRLEVEYNMFFAGRLPRLPWETRARVEKLVKQYDRMNLSNTAQRFRFGTVQARFMSFCELWERNLRAKEEGRLTRGRMPAASPPSPQGESSPAEDAARQTTAAEPAAVAPPGAAAASPRGALDTMRIRDLGRDSDRVTALYDELTRARQATGEPPMPFERFATVVKAQLAKLGGGSNDVSFRVAVNQGKVRLMANRVDE